MLASTMVVVLVLGTMMSVTSEAGQAGLSTDLIDRFEEQFDKRGDNRSLINAVTNNSISKISLNRDKLIAHNKHFNHKLQKNGITNQKGSGRCWLFAGLNVFNPTLMTKLNLTSFELSEPYLTFWDKMEKANLFLEEIIALRDRPSTDRKLEVLLEEPFGDGGWWHYVTDLIGKYGIVPLSAMPETEQSSSTGLINELINRKLRAAAAELRRMHSSGKSENILRERKEGVLSDIYTALVYAYGKPPKSFVFRYEGKDSTISEPKEYTPRSFYETFLAADMPRFTILMDNPNKEYGRLFQIESSRNMADKADMTLLNLPADKIKRYCTQALLDSQVVWFACDVGQDHYRDSGILATDIYDYNATFGIDFKISKADRINYLDSYPNHAMALLGMDTASDGRPVKWLVENSWGTEKGDKGYWYMYDDWFTEYVYVAVVDERHLDPEDRDRLKQTPEVLPVWDPFWKAMRYLK
ncbi:MAG TPA: C1 family peptidase [Candidatus Deferrimicrobium sp.]|nr:C1 family peptidase [Candidatus Deferrimicrobium sp.]